VSVNAEFRVTVASLLAQRLHVRGDELLDQAVEAARAQGASWTEIGGALQTSKQAAQQRFAVVAEVPAPDSPFGLTGAAADVLAAAADEARELGHHYVRPEHLLLGLLSLPEEMAARALEADGVTADVARAALVKQFPPPHPDRQARSASRRRPSDCSSSPARSAASRGSRGSRADAASYYRRESRFTATEETKWT
jgi:ATP-dependent Clp protease ATP-binding subunit ClpA